MILSVSRRTDIPCWYSEWFMNRVHEGYALTRNPLNPMQVSRVPVNPDIIDCIVFWTKDPQPFLRNLDELDRLGFRYYFQFTLTPYDRDLEPNLRSKKDIIETFVELSKRVGRSRIIWRYDPIILTERYTLDYHKKSFMNMCSSIAPYTDTVTISFVDLYKKTRRTHLREIKGHEMDELSSFIAHTAKAYTLSVTACCEHHNFSQYGIVPASCIDPIRISRICGCPMDLKADRNQREGCGCMESVDIGAYNSCINGCIYCYANTNPETAVRYYQSHCAAQPFLNSYPKDSDRIHERKYASNRRTQISFFAEK